jgi:hypothetical protein
VQEKIVDSNSNCLGTFRSNHVRASRTSEHLVCLLKHLQNIVEKLLKPTKENECRLKNDLHIDSVINFAERSRDTTSITKEKDSCASTPQRSSLVRSFRAFLKFLEIRNESAARKLFDGDERWGVAAPRSVLNTNTTIHLWHQECKELS